MTTSQAIWDRRFMGLALQVKTWSKDPAEGVGAVVVSPDKLQFSVGYNGLPKGSRFDDAVSTMPRVDKNRLTIHAERNALDNAPFNLQGATLYVTKAPCFECMKGIIQKGVVRVIAPPLNRDSRWFCDQCDARHLAADHSVLCEEIF